MKILAIETSGYCGSVAISDGTLLLGECLINAGPRHSERLMVMIDWLLKEAGVEKRDLEAISVSTGPGSFTSLRIGLGIAKGMAYSLGIKISGVSSLDTLASGIQGTERNVCPMIDAKRGEVYAKILKKDMKRTEVLEEGIISIEELCNHITRDTVFLGEGAKLYRDKISETIPGHAHFTNDVLDLPRASNMCLISYEKLIKGVEDNVFIITPNYIRKSYAESNLKKNPEKEKNST